jgi:hypothetical protein
MIMGGLHIGASIPSRLRFDYPVSESAGQEYAMDVQKVVTHAFFPFISYDKVSPRYNKAEKKVKLKIRPIMYASHMDSAIYSYYASYLSKAYESVLQKEGLNDCVIAYRKLGKSNVDFASHAFTIVKTIGNCCVICVDIKDFFGSLDHTILKQSWQNLIGQPKLPGDHYKVFRSVTSYAHVNRNKLAEVLGENNLEKAHTLCTPEAFRTKVRPLIEVNECRKGIPQGSPISAVLSNVYMIEFDKAMLLFCRECQCHYLRYSDDILIVAPPSLEQSVLEFVDCQLCKMHLMMNRKKLEICHFFIDQDVRQTCDKPLQYLGFTYDGNKVLIRPSTLSRYNRKLRKYITLSERRARDSKSARLYRRKAYNRFTMRGKRNFISYAQRAHEIMSRNHSSAIRNQIKRHWAMVNRLLDDADTRLATGEGKKT